MTDDTTDLKAQLLRLQDRLFRHGSIAHPQQAYCVEYAHDRIETLEGELEKKKQLVAEYIEASANNRERAVDAEHELEKKKQLLITYVEASQYNLDRAKAAERERDEARSEVARLREAFEEAARIADAENYKALAGQSQYANGKAATADEIAEAIRAKAKEASDE